MAEIKNPQLDLAYNYAHFTNKNIYLTGKAGTGKTTFLHRLKKETTKRLVIVAPTGVAAINAGGVTIHSFFQLPFGPYLPGMAKDPANQRKFTREKIRLIQSMDLLVIDEISMVRSDVLDAIDDVLRRYKNYFEPFGGVQLLMIGDLHQLPPVVKEDEWEMLRSRYQTPYFFGSHALQKTQPVAIELKHIYRQSDNIFISILNKVRNNHIDNNVLEALNSRYIPNFQPDDSEGYITLTSHNNSAQDINARKLSMIEKPIQQFRAKVSGDFPEFSFPNDEVLEFKLGAQVMFVKNDISKEKLYFNGKIGTITNITEEEIIVQCKDDPAPIVVRPVEWSNVKYTLDEHTREINEEKIGTFIQVPLKLAWAITIHKSQGLTFDKAIIDANAAFAHGQVYVALSRCRTFEGLVLRSKITPASVKTDHVVKQYSDEIERNLPDENHLIASKRVFQESLLKSLFLMKPLNKLMDNFHRLLLENQTIINPSAIVSLNMAWIAMETTLFNVAEKFEPQLEQYFAQGTMPDENTLLQERLQKASVYFIEKLKKIHQDIQNITIITDNKAVKHSIEESKEQIERFLYTKEICFAAIASKFDAVQFIKAKSNADIDFEMAKRIAQTANLSSSLAPKDSQHPQLYSMLRKWRDDTAAEYQLEEYMVVGSRTILELSNALPRNVGDLKRIKGIGATKVTQFGAEILAIVEKYCQDKNIVAPEPSLLDKPIKEKTLKPVKAPKEDTKSISFNLYKSGKSIQEIAAERGMVAGTIEGHLAHYVGLGEIDIFDFMDTESFNEIVAHYEVSGTHVGAFAHFEGKYTYGQLKMVTAYLNKNEQI
jgi:hypothetical protein